MNNPNDFNVTNFHVRLLSVMGLMGIFFMIILGRTYYLQIYNAEFYEEKAQRQHERTVTLETRRGTIYDRRGNILAVSVPVESLYSNPHRIASPKQLSRTLASRLSLPYQEVVKKLRSSKSFVWIKRKLSPTETQTIKQMDIEGLGFLNEFRRYYPADHLAGPLLGFTGIDSQGLEGLEFEYQYLLRGKMHKYVVERDGTQRTIPSPEPDIQRPNRYALHLTIDRSIQYFAEKALREGIAKSKARRGSALVMHSSTGAILAMATNPGLNPNHFQDYDRSTYINRTATTGYEPGSTFKPITVAIALEERKIQPDQIFFCEKGKYRIANKTIHDTHPYENMSVREIIQKSSNICAAKIGALLKPERFHHYIREFGFGAKTGVGLSAEATGSVLPPKRWTSVDQASISFGHGTLVSPIQLLTAINVFAAGGMLIPPYIVDHAENNQGEVFKEIRDDEEQLIAVFGQREPRKIISPHTAETVKQFMISVTESGGTAPAAAMEGYTVAGKTGTTQIFDEKTRKYSNKKHIALFAGFVPASSPVLTILIIVELPQTSPYGGTVAAPIFKEIAQRSLVLLDVYPNLTSQQ